MEHGVDRQVKPSIDLICQGHVARYKFAASRVKDYVLDAACGVGYGSQLMHKRAEVTGIDIEPEAIDYARLHYPGPTYKVHDLESSSPFPQNAYDWVVCLETIEHLKKPELALMAFRASDKLIISTPNQSVIPFRPEKHQGEYPHQRHYTPNEFQKLLASCGWKVVETASQTKFGLKKNGAAKELKHAYLIWVCE